MYVEWLSEMHIRWYRYRSWLWSFYRVPPGPETIRYIRQTQSSRSKLRHTLCKIGCGSRLRHNHET